MILMTALATHLAITKALATSTLPPYNPTITTAKALSSANLGLPFTKLYELLDAGSGLLAVFMAGISGLLVMFGRPDGFEHLFNVGKGLSIIILAPAGIALVMLISKIILNAFLGGI